MLPFARYCAARREIRQVDLSPARACCLTVAFLVGAASGWAEEPRGEDAQIRQGRALFVKQWQEHDRQSPDGDGLGPMYNARSCAECHSQSGVGGGGDVLHNVEMLNLIAPERKEGFSRQAFIEAVGKVHPSLVANAFTVRPSVTLHRFGSNPAYEKWRVAMVLLTAYLPAGQVPDRIALEIARRNTPALFGSGVIDAIPGSVLEDVARRQQAQRGDVKGRVAVAGGGQPGKFGWRGQTASLRQFVMGACANELGLQVPENNQPQDPLDPDGKAPGLDLKQQQCDALVAFVASLPPPAERLPLSHRQEQQWAAGSQLFKRVGCADCHVPKLGEVAGIYSDLLLHDMGPDLADQAGANRTSPAVGQNSDGRRFLGTLF
jgi:CxxC motif-containing protein (DUF1111 family)